MSEITLKSSTKRFRMPEASIPQVFGHKDRFLKMITKAMGTSVSFVGGELTVTGDEASVQGTVDVLQYLLEVAIEREVISDDVNTAVRMSINGDIAFAEELSKDRVKVAGGLKIVSPKSRVQKDYINAIRDKDMVFAYGPAGTGKTFLAVAMAVNYYLEKKINKIILTRPAVEAGEKLGFLPGDLAEKINPYLRPLHDALQAMLDPELVVKLMEKGVIEVAPLAFMRGRTLSNAFVILDEAQNTTISQMKMFLTRLGFGSKAVITGDTTQVDLPSKSDSGLDHAIKTLKYLDEIGFIHLSERDVVRHPLVSKIIRAYEEVTE